MHTGRYRWAQDARSNSEKKEIILDVIDLLEEVEGRRFLIETEPAVWRLASRKEAYNKIAQVFRETTKKAQNVAQREVRFVCCICFPLLSELTKYT